jgi:hypothetical protein
MQGILSALANKFGNKARDDVMPLIDKALQGKWKDLAGTAYETVAPLPLQAMTYSPEAEAALIKLYHGGKAFKKWDPKKIGSGEGFLMPLGPGLYAGNNPQLAEVYMKYGGKDPALLELLVDDTNILQTSKKMSPLHRAAYDAATKRFDEMGLRGSSNGIPNSFLSGRYYDKELTRNALVDSKIDGLKQHLNDDFGDEFAIYNPDIIKSITRLK